MPSFRIINPPENLGMNDFRSVNDNYEGLLKSCRFAVQIRPIGERIQRYSSFCRDFTYLCEVAEIPGRGFINLDLRYYGPSFKLPVQTSYEDMTLTFICRTGSFERQFFDDWMQEINPLHTYDFSYRDEYRSEIDIFQFSDIENDQSLIRPIEGGASESPAAVYFVTLHNAYPLLVNPQPLTWSDDQFLRVAVSFTYTNWSRKGWDTQPGYTRELVKNRVNEGRGLNYSEY